MAKDNLREIYESQILVEAKLTKVINLEFNPEEYKQLDINLKLHPEIGSDGWAIQNVHHEKIKIIVTRKENPKELLDKIELLIKDSKKPKSERQIIPDRSVGKPKSEIENTPEETPT